MIVGIIPARGGSKGIPRKNIKPLLGKPLVVWSIEAAQESKRLDDFFVSTDDEDIAGVCVATGAKVEMRPKELAADDSTTLDVLKHHLGNADIIVLLQPTSPIRTGWLIDCAVRNLMETSSDTLATGYWSTHGDWKTTPHGPRQKQKSYFHDDGCIYAFKREVIESNRWVGDKPYEMVIPPEYSLEIDSEIDFLAVEGILAYTLAR